MVLTFNELPQAVGRLYTKLENIERLLALQGNIQPESDEIFTIQEAAKFIRLAVVSVYGLVSRSEIPSMKKGKRLYFSKFQLTEWIKSGRKKTTLEITADVDSYLVKNRAL